MISYQAATLSAAGEIVGDSEHVVLDPEEWVGESLTIAKHIDIGDQLLSDMWIVLFFDHGCSSCQEAVANYEQLADRFQANPAAPTIALIECPPYGDEHIAEQEGLAYGRLSDLKVWELKTPLAMLVDGGRVEYLIDNPRNTELLEAVWGL